ncbi:MAG TPA: hypothetical protein VFQ12_11370, partial [Thermoleophilaceae bacterium]|nr:hypothetical protein [Thermoleophilaceae bacterium]
YHLWHGQGHLLASSYYLVPAGVYLALALLRGDELFGRRSGETRPVLRWASPRTFGTLGLCVLIGWSDVYYVAFTLVLVLGAAIGAALAGTSPRRLLVGLGLGGAIAVATLIALTPALIYRLDNGANEEVAKRGGAETETFSTNLAQLVMPVPGHPVAALDDLQQRYRDASEVGREPTPLGLAATIGFLWLVLVALIAVVRPSRGPPAEGSALEDPRDRRLSFAVIIALAFATTGGISALVAWTITPLLRDSGRMAIFIALLSLAGLALLLDRTGRALSHRLRLPPIVLAGALGLLVTVAVLDQTSWKLLPDYAVNEVRWRTDQAFVEQIEGILPSDAQVFQLPYLPFPETRPVFGLGDSGHFTGYVHSHDLRWSYAAMRGREADWQATFSDRPMQEVVPAVVAAGFDGLWLDRAGYSDRAAKVEAELREILGYGPATERADGQALFWDLRAYAAALRGRQSAKRLSLLAESTLEPVRWIHAKGFHERQVAADGSLRWTSEPAAELRLENPSDGERDNELRMQLARPGGTHAFVIVTFPDGREKTLLAKPEGSAVREPLRVPPGRSTLRLRVRAAPIKEGHEGRTLYVQVNQLQIVDPATLVTR